MKVNIIAAGVLVGLVLVVCGLAAFGHQLGMSHGALAWCQAFAAVVGGGVLSMLPKVVELAEKKLEEATAPRPTRVPPSRESGHAAVDAMLAVVMVGGAILAWLLHGCGASAPVVVAGVETGVHFTCQVAREVCSWTEPMMTTENMRQKHDAACSMLDTACHAVGAKH